MMKVLAGNWKMHKTREETRAFFGTIGSKLQSSSVRKIVAPSPTLLETAVAASQGSGIEVFAQNISWAEAGAFTGETSVAQLFDLGVKGTIIGHSERRQYFNETDETACKKAALALDEGLDVIYCIGERIEDRKANRTHAVLESQIKPLIEKVLPELSQQSADRGALVIAYEPVWAIGTGLTANSEQIADAHAYIAQLLNQAKRPLPILYGGSVKVDNMNGIAKIAHVSGGLVGGASLEAAAFIALHEALLNS